MSHPDSSLHDWVEFKETSQTEIQELTMRKSYHTRTTRLGLLVGGLGLLLVAPAFGEDGSCCTTQEASCCNDCDKIFQDAGAKLNEQLGSCCDTGCDSCDGTGCDSCCDDGCGSGCCVLDGSCLFGDCCLGDPWTLQDHLGCFTDECGEKCITFGGWTQWGYTTSSTGLFNVNPDRVHNNQSWLYIEKVADGSEGFDYGFRADFMYGVDGFTTQAFGNNPGRWDFMNGYDFGIYGWAMPQLYGEVAYGDWAVKVGHFYTLVGYEVVTAPDNFFFSHAFTMFNNEPFTHTGALATYSGIENVEIYGGWTAGWDTGFDRFNDGDNSNGSSFLGGAALTLTDDLTVTYIATAGDLGTRGEGYSHSVVVDAQLTEELNYVFQTDLVETNAGTAPATAGDHQFSINQYLFYWPSECLGYGARAEWWKTSGNSIYEVTAGINVKPSANLVIRPEYRYQWTTTPGLLGPLDDSQGIFAVDAIVTF